MSEQIIGGLHHVTAITADAQKNIDFYTGVLGLRLVKLTVNFDDPASYHLYYGDELGRPGTIMTFFAWPGAYRGQVGPPQVSVTAFAAPLSSLDFWAKQLNTQNVEPISERFGQRVLGFVDPDGMRLEIVGVADVKGQPWTKGGIPAEHAIRSFHGVTISEEGYENTAKLLTEVMGFKFLGSESNRFRYRAGDGIGSVIDIVCIPGGRQGSMGAGVVHHVAFRTSDDAQQGAWRKQIASLGFNISPVMDRNYFHSIYYREPGGVLFEIATENPGFSIDEPVEKLGTKLMLPPPLEQYRAEIEKVVTPIRLPKNLN
jgi:catechol 2,3-dioxygenase-like lactoylglutathione lyase family enzyme